MINSNSKAKFACIFFCLIGVLSLHTYAESQSKQVRVGYFLFDGFHENYGDGHRSGYGYEYLQKLTEYVDWEYVYIPGTWQELLLKLENGEIDLLTSATYVESRAKVFDYSSLPMGINYNCIFINKQANIQYGDISYIQGKSVGLMQGNSINENFFSFCEQQNLSTLPLYFGNTQEMEQALQDGTISAIISSNLRHNKNEKTLTQFGEKPFYCVTKKGNQELLNDLNYAMQQLKNDYPNYESKLFEKYYERKQKMFEFTPAELKYIQTKPVFTIGYLADLSPIEYYDDTEKTITGIVPEIMNLISIYSGISFEYVPFSDYNTMLEALKSQKIDLVARMPENFALAEDYNAWLSNPYIYFPNTSIAKNDDDITATAKIAIPKNRNDLIYQAQQLHPSAAIITLDTWQDCINALKSETVDFLLQNTYITENIFFGNGIYDARDWKIISDTTSPFCLAVGKHNDRILLRILNKSMRQITMTEKRSIIMLNTKDQPLSFFGLLHKYYYQSAICIAILVIFIMAIILHFNRLNETLLVKMASVDHLTKVYNRSSITYEINKYLHEHQNSQNTLFILDIDKFKVLNDDYGHPFGDRVLVLAASCLKNIFQDRAMIGRLGGDEFVVFLKDTATVEEITTCAETINQSFREIQNEHNHVITCSIGIAKTPEHGSKFSDLYNAADQSLYIVKQHGRNSYSLAAIPTAK